MNFLKSFDSIGIIGYGQFGRVLYDILKPRFPEKKIKISSRSNRIDQKKFFSLEDTVDSDFIIPCVAIRAFEEVIEEISKFIKTGATTMDVNSVKLHPVEVMEKNLPQGVNIIASHPMWGAGTIKHNENSTKNLNMVLWNVRSDENKYKEIKSFLEDDLELNLTEMDPDEHDRLSAKFQFLTQVSAQVYKSLGLQETDIDTKSAILVRELIEIVQADKDLTKDMYVFNPYCKKELELMDKYYSEFKEFLKL